MPGIYKTFSKLSISVRVPVPERALCVKGRLANFCAHGSRQSPVGLSSDRLKLVEESVFKLGRRGHFVARLFAPFFSRAAAPLSIPS
jgi:hypothetical protein